MATGNLIHAAARRSLSLHILALAAAAVLSCAHSGIASASTATVRAPNLALAGSGTLSLELKAKSDVDPELKLSASCRVGQVSSSLQYRPGGALELKVNANLTEDWRQFRDSGSLTISGSIDPGDPKASWNQISMSTSRGADKKAMPWQPEMKMELSARGYPNNPVRDYTEAKLTTKAGKTLPGEGNPSVKGELSVGHKEMPSQPKWTANFWSSMISLQWRPTRDVQAAASLAAKGRAYPEASHKSYTTYTGKASAAWALSKQQSLEFAASAQSTVRPKDASKDRKTADASAKWTLKTPAASIAPLMAGSLTLTARATAGATLLPNLPDESVAWRAGASSGLTWEVSKTLKLSVAAETAWSATFGSDDPDDDDDQDDNNDDNEESHYLAQQVQGMPALAAHPGSASIRATAGSTSAGGASGKATHRLNLSVTAGPYGSVTFSGKAIAVRTDELNQGIRIDGAWVPSLELKASYKF
jgi:hypothetical protein